ncbi:uncharacterized protein LOC115970335 [Quercus lobata]|uniref:uncharacterized protein LOC115970335 n=1 Tax=Quercus lobata TaxID=97700 RepID=UPI001244BD45|nr:uncharacterized protein LOC115970335 [Quercus lobata]
MSGTGAGSYQTQRTVSGATGRRQREERDEELERLRRLVRGLELEVKGKRRRRERNVRQQEVRIGRNRYGQGSNQFGSQLRFSELIQEFGVRFLTCSRVSQPVDALFLMKIRSGKTLCSYASRYWELYNEIGRDNERVAASTFRMGLPEDFGLRESLTKKPPEGMRQLMRRIEEYKRLKDDRLQRKGKVPMMNRPRQIGFPFRPRGGLAIQEPAAQMGEVNVTFKEPVHRILDRIKHEPYFQWPNKIRGDPSKRNQNLYYAYHRDKGHTTEQCRVLKDHLGQLVKVGHLKDFVLDSGDRVVGQDNRQMGNPLPSLVGVIEVIHVAPEKLIAGRRKEVLTVVPVEGNLDLQSSGKKMKFAW